MDSIELKLCDIQGRLFELAWKEHYNSERFIEAPAKTMNVNYLMFHTMDPEMAVEDLKEIYRQKRGV